MKRIFLLITLLWLCLFAQGQITRSIWGLTLGSSTAEDIRNTLIEKGYSSKINESTSLGDRNISVETYPIRFGGVEWNKVIFTVRNGRLYDVSFCLTSESSALTTAKKLYTSLYNKYPSYKLARYPWETYDKIDIGNEYGPHELIYSRDLAVCFRDGRTQIILTHDKNTEIYPRVNRKEIEYNIWLIYSDSNLDGVGSESDL